MRLFNNALGMFLLATGAMLLAPALPGSAQIPPPFCVTDEECTDPDLPFCFIFFCVECVVDSQCDDGLFCTGEEECGINGVCFDGPLPCPAGLACNEEDETCELCVSDDDCDAFDGPCTEGVCDKGTGICDSEPANEGDACDDGNDCTDDVCEAGVCESTPNEAECDDSNDCTDDDVCADGVCAGTAVDCDDTDECTVDLCIDGNCLNLPVDCDDGDACTDDTCSDGECVHDDMDCDDGDLCTDDACLFGSCVTFPTDCDDGDACTDDTCDPVDGCVNVPADCDDGDACTDDGCDEATGCVNEPTDCDDGDACTTDACDSTDGCSNTPMDCDDGDACTEDSCSAGVCAHDAIVCADSDNNPCTAESCQSGVCVAVPIDCEDNNPCTDDTCLNGGCINTNNFIACNDGDACTENDACGAGACAGDLIDNCTPCATAADCTGDLQCTGGQCQPAQVTLCVEGACTEEGESCVNGDCRADCDDDNPCGDNETCVNGHCFGACVEDANCDDGMFCNGAETCDNNICVAGEAAACAEGEECNTETDMCEEVSGICGAGLCGMSSPFMGLTLLALFCLRGSYRRVRAVGRTRTRARRRTR